MFRVIWPNLHKLAKCYYFSVTHNYLVSEPDRWDQWWRNVYYTISLKSEKLMIIMILIIILWLYSFYLSLFLTPNRGENNEINVCLQHSGKWYGKTQTCFTSALGYRWFSKRGTNNKGKWKCSINTVDPLMEDVSLSDLNVAWFSGCIRYNAPTTI